jgi:hypothetical protein
MLDNFFRNSVFRKVRLETCLNGKFPFVLNAMPENSTDETNVKGNSVPNQIQPRKQPGLYMIRCTKNDWRYYGESGNVSGRLASHRSLLNRNIHPNFVLQYDYNKYGSDFFDSIVLFMGEKWEQTTLRRGKETELIVLDRAFCYNIISISSRPGETNPFWGRVHTPETKKKISEALKNKPNDLLGKSVSVKQVIYPSIAAASRSTGVARKTIGKKIDDPTQLDYYAVDDLRTVERPS